MKTLDDNYGYKTACELAVTQVISYGASILFNYLRRFAGSGTKTQHTEKWLAQRLNVTDRTIRNWIRELEACGMISTKRAPRSIWFTFQPDYSTRWTKLCPSNQTDPTSPTKPQAQPAEAKVAAKPQPARRLPAKEAQKLIARFGRQHSGDRAATRQEVERSKNGIVQFHGQQVFDEMMVQLAA